MTLRKPAETAAPVHELIRDRWSPRAFDPQPVPRQAVVSIFEAARWAASASNEQPWHFIIAGREDAEAFGRALDCLVPGNQAWANNAGLLALTIVRLTRGNVQQHFVVLARPLVTGAQIGALRLLRHHQLNISCGRSRE